MYLYLDESGDLGFDFTNKNPSGFFIITLLAISAAKTIKIINKTVARTQAVDMFCYGIARKYELSDLSWYDLFKDKIAIECEFKV